MPTSTTHAAHPATPTHHPYASVLRQRAGHLRELAADIERSLAARLVDDDPGAWDDDHVRLAEALFVRSAHQLYRATEQLRETACRFHARADELDHAHRARRAA